MIPGRDEPAPQPPAHLSAGLRLPEWDAASAPGRDVAAWRYGYVWMRLGRYDHAFAWWADVDDPAVVPWVHVSRAAALRELGRHEPAQREDRAALRAGRDPLAIAAARIGMVADAVGSDAPEQAVRRLEAATVAVRSLPDDLASDRQRIRLGWVACEVALLTGGLPTVPLPHLDRTGALVQPSVYRAGSRHHLAKGLLFAGVLAADLDLLDAAADRAPPGLLWAVHRARADLGATGAAARARAARDLIVVPDELSDAPSAPGGPR